VPPPWEVTTKPSAEALEEDAAAFMSAMAATGGR
jgi:hypothetical protein